MGVDENSEAGDKKADAMESKGMKSKVSEKECERNETLVCRSPPPAFYRAEHFPADCTALSHRPIHRLPV